MRRKSARGTLQTVLRVCSDPIRAPEGILTGKLYVCSVCFEKIRKVKMNPSSNPYPPYTLSCIYSLVTPPNDSPEYQVPVAEPIPLLI